MLTLPTLYEPVLLTFYDRSMRRLDTATVAVIDSAYLIWPWLMSHLKSRCRSEILENRPGQEYEEHYFVFS